MKSKKLKLGLAAMAFALIGAGFTSVQADEYWRPDKETGDQIQQTQCLENNPTHCATVYANNSDVPKGVLNGSFVPNP